MKLVAGLVVIQKCIVSIGKAIRRLKAEKGCMLYAVYRMLQPMFSWELFEFRRPCGNLVCEVSR